jgi:ADP-ribose pyrophosphatase YjhB (NUDIX family)
MLSACFFVPVSASASISESELKNNVKPFSSTVGCLKKSNMLPTTERWARIGPTRKSWLIHVPRAGLCLSAFVIVINYGNDILLGLPKEHEAWPKAGGLPKFHSKQLEVKGEFLLPATHLLMEESPDHAARRIAREWVGYKNAKPSFKEVQSHLRPSELWRTELGDKHGVNHWDICFIYSMQVDDLPSRINPWWREMRFVSPSQISKLNIGRGHKDVLKEAGYISRI